MFMFGSENSNNIWGISCVNIKVKKDKFLRFSKNWLLSTYDKALWRECVGRENMSVRVFKFLLVKTKLLNSTS